MINIQTPERKHVYYNSIYFKTIKNIIKKHCSLPATAHGFQYDNRQGQRHAPCSLLLRQNKIDEVVNSCSNILVDIIRHFLILFCTPTLQVRSLVSSSFFRHCIGYPMIPVLVWHFPFSPFGMGHVVLKFFSVKIRFDNINFFVIL